MSSSAKNILGRLVTHFSPPHKLPGSGFFVVSSLIGGLGRGIWVPFSLLYFHLVVGLPLPLVGLGLAIGGGWGLAITPVSGILVDRFGSRMMMILWQLLLGGGFIAYLFVHSFAAFLAAVLFISTAQAIVGTAFPVLVTEMAPPEDRDWWFGFSRSSYNLGIGGGGLAAGVAITLGGTMVYHWLAFVTALTFVIAGLLLFGLRMAQQRGPSVSRPLGPGERTRAGYLAVLRDGPFLGIVLANTVLALSFFVLEIALPPYLISNIHTPAWIFGTLYTINTAMVVLIQLPIMRLLATHRRTRAMAASGLIYGTSFLLFAATPLLPQFLLVAYLVAVMVIYTFAELLLAPSSIGLTAAIAPAALRGRYMAVAGLSYGINTMLAPLLFTALLSVNPLSLWLLLALMMALAAFAVVLLERKLPPHSLQAVQDERQTPVLEDEPVAR